MFETEKMWMILRVEMLSEFACMLRVSTVDAGSRYAISKNESELKERNS